MSRRKNFVKHSINFIHKRCKGIDCGSGTMLGIMLVIAVCSILVLSAILCNVLGAKHQAYAVATSAALSGASALQRMEDNACEVVARTVASSNAFLKSCNSTSNDVTVRISVGLNIPFASNVEVSARAGLEDCNK
ncbi:Rv3654c family TadE-like protein [Gardnerella sp. DNF00497B]|uniref:Rv3654c family TadE-like protein n=1 Tax=Gardnerella sp. DNF00497B TaxID=2749048 RepID=UPI003BAE30D5